MNSLKKFLAISLVLGLIVVVGFFWFPRWARSDAPAINYILPAKYSGVVVIHGSNNIVLPTKGTQVFVQIDSKGHGTINRKYLTTWHSTHFSDGIMSIPEWIENKDPTDSKVRAFSIITLNLKLFPAVISDAYFVGTFSQFKEFEKTHPKD